MAHRLEPGMAEEMGDVVLAPGEVVVDAEHVVAARDQAVAEMRAEEAGAPGHQHAFAGQARGGFGHASSLGGRAAGDNRARAGL